MSNTFSQLLKMKEYFHIDQINLFQNRINGKKEVFFNNCKVYYTNFINSHDKFDRFDNILYLRDFFSLNEIQVIQNFQKKYRKFEWLFGRLLVKIAIIEYLEHLNLKIPNLNQIEIISDLRGVPRFKKNNFSNRSIYCSISHKSGNIVTATSIQNQIGIDIEKIRIFSDSLSKKAFLPSEIEDISLFLQPKKGSLNENYIKSGLWCIKEAISKAIGLGLGVNFQDIKVEGIKDKIFGFYCRNGIQDRFVVKLINKEEYLIAIAKKFN